MTTNGPSVIGCGVLRRSLPAAAGLFGLLFIGGAVAVSAGAPVWSPLAVGIVLLGVQFVLSPIVIERLVPASVIEHDGMRYLTDDPLGEIVAQRCRDAAIPLVRLGIVDDGTPNAFTFGRVRRDARMWVSRGLLERLDRDELDAVVAHEVGHVRHWDFAFMTVAAVIPIALYSVFLAMSDARDEGQFIAIAAYAAYLVSQMFMLALSRSREYGADLWACASTGKGDALASALVKIAYGIGEVRAAERDAAGAIARQSGDRRELARQRQRARRMRAVQALGIVDPGRSAAGAATFASGVDTERAIKAMRWDVTNPWAAVLEKFSTHPLVARRIDALERSGAPGRPQLFANLRALAAAGEAESVTTRVRFAEEALLFVAPWCVGPLTYVLLGASTFALGAALTATGVALFLLQHRRCPSGSSRVAAVASLLERLDAGPVAGIPVEVRGRVMGRGVPGYMLSPDLVVEDGSGFVPLVYRQPIGVLATWFALFRATDFLGAEVVARGWFRRGPGPFVELRDVRRVGDASDRSARAWSWFAWFVVAGAAVVGGVVLMAFGAAA